MTTSLAPPMQASGTGKTSWERVLILPVPQRAIGFQTGSPRESDQSPTRENNCAIYEQCCSNPKRSEMEEFYNGVNHRCGYWCLREII